MPDLSISEKAAQQKIYKIYMETLNNLPDEWGCGTQASVFYMGHSTSCGDFKHVHERESHEVLLAILNKKKKLSLDAEFDPRHQNYEVQVAADADVADFEQVVPIPNAKEASSELNNSSPQAMSMVAKNITSVTKPPNNPPNPSSITDIPVMNEEKTGWETWRWRDVTFGGHHWRYYWVKWRCKKKPDENLCWIGLYL